MTKQKEIKKLRARGLIFLLGVLIGVIVSSIPIIIAALARILGGG